MEQHSCRICRQSFPCSRSLGDHMRSHYVLSPPMKDEEKLLSIHDLRINPKKSQRFEIEWKDKNRAKLEKDSSSVKGSCEMTREEMIRGDNGDLRSRGSYGEREMSGQPYSKLNAFSMPVKKKRTRSAPMVVNASVSPLEFSWEVAKAAESLVMLSREYANLKRASTDMFSPATGSRNEVHYSPFKNEDRQSKKLKVSSLASSIDHGDINPAVPKNKKKSLSIQCDSESRLQSSSNKKMYKCSDCEKSFDSYQALGGHRTSHNKLRGESKNLTNRNRDSKSARKSPENLGDHVCNICTKSFESGQALGGHKRSHSIAAHNSVAAAVVPSCADSTAAHPHPPPMQIERNFFNLDSIDLNFPAPDNDS